MNSYRWNDLALGMKSEFAASFSEEMVQAFAALSGDRNPLHVDRAYAHSVGFPRPVVFGMLTSSLYSQLVGVYLPGKYALLHGIDIHFTSPCFAGDRLNVAGEIVYLGDALHRLELAASIRGEDRKLISRASIRVGLHA